MPNTFLNTDIYSKFFLVLFICIPSITYSQDEEWIRAFGASGYQIPHTISSDKQGNVFVSGWGTGFLPDTSREHPFALKYDSDGNFKWIRSLPVQGACWSHTLDNTGNLYLLSSYGQFDVSITKFSTQGNTVWTLILTAESPTEIIYDNKFIYSLMRKRSPNMQEYDYFITKHDTSANLIWATAIDSTHPGSEEPIDMAIDDSGNVYITGYSDITPITSYTVKLDSSGNKRWESLRQTGDFDCPSFSVALDDLGNCYIAGNSFHIPVGTDKYKIIKYDINGNVIWEKSPILGKALKVLVDNTGNPYISGFEGTLKLDSSGNVIRYDSAYGGTILLDNNGNLFDNRTPLDSIGLNSTLKTTKKDSAGNVLWIKNKTLNNNYTFGGGDFCLANNSVYIVIKKVLYPNLNDSLWVIKYSQQLIGVEPISSIVPKQFQLFQNYPNPFNPSTLFKFQVSKSAYIRIVLYNVLGEEVTTFLNENLKAGEYKVTYNAVYLASGIYFYTMFADNKLIDTKKMLLVK